MAVSGSDIVAYAQQFLGTPYAWGGNSLTDGVDCSGLVQQVYKHFGITVPRTTYDQITQGKAVSMNQLQAGDLLFFHTASADSPDHVGIYIGNGKFIEAPRPGKGVQISDLKSGYYQQTFLGARRIGGVDGGNVSGGWDPSSPGSAEAKLNPTELAAEYGWSYSFLNSIPELKRLFADSVANTWSKDMFQAKLRDTSWWKENSASMRQVALQKSTDPATYSANLNAMKIQVQQLAAEMGAIIPPGKLDSIADQAMLLNLNEGGLRNVLGGYVNFVGKTLVGHAGMYEDAIKKYAYSQGVTLDDQAIKNQAALIERKLATPEDYQEQIKQQAISAFPAYKTQLDSGVTLHDIAQPYIQAMAQQLDLNPNTITVTDPLIKQALNATDNNGKPVGMDQTAFMGRLRSDPRWNQTQGAQDDVMKVGNDVLKSMGLIG